MLMTGCGLGYRIETLIAKFDIDIDNLHFIDPQQDSVYAALHTIDWGPILENSNNPTATSLSAEVIVNGKNINQDFPLLKHSRQRLATALSATQ